MSAIHNDPYWYISSRIIMTWFEAKCWEFVSMMNFPANYNKEFYN